MQAFELKESIHFYRNALQQGQKTVMASLVGLEGSSYRQPGVRMLIAQDGSMCGALSGGCVENEIVSSAQSVFKTGVSKVISYDGRYRLGCEGLLYILIEPFEVSHTDTVKLLKHIENRLPIEMRSTYKSGTAEVGDFYSTFSIGSEIIPTHPLKSEVSHPYSVFKQTISPASQLLIIGAEHDAEKLCANSVLLGWDTIIIASPKNPKTLTNFPGAKYILKQTPETMDLSIIDAYTSIVLMTHNYAQDLNFLLKIKDREPLYIGILGSQKRKAALENELLEHAPELSSDFLEKLHSPAGLDISAVTPQEIAVSIISEIVQITRNKKKSPNVTTTQVKQTLS